MDEGIGRETDRYKYEWVEGRVDGWAEEWFYKRMVSGRMERKSDIQARISI
jgi:hypothetical protein